MKRLFIVMGIVAALGVLMLELSDSDANEPVLETEVYVDDAPEPSAEQVTTSALKEGSTGKLQKFPSSETSGACGEYFLFTGVPADQTKVGIITFIFEFTTEAGERGITIPLFGTDKVRVRVVDKQETPTATVLRTGGPQYPWIEISISRQDYERAPCLQYANQAA